MFYRFLCAVVAFCLAGSAARAEGFSLIRDAEIEGMIRTWATPLFNAAGLDPSAVRIYLVNDGRLNAFVAGGQNLFLNTGLLTRSENVNQVVGVMAHETGHIAGGHLARSQEAMENAFKQSLLGMALGALAAAASKGQAAGAIFAGSGAFAQQSLMQFSQAQESSADAAGLSFLDKTGQSAQGLYDFFKILEGQELLSPARQDPYLRTHPLTRQRMNTVEEHIRLAKASGAPSPAGWDEMHTRMKAKLAAFLGSPAAALSQWKESDKSIAARYARAIAYYRIPDLKRALPAIDGLIADEPQNPYFHELKGQVLFENGRIAEAVAPYEESVRLAPKSGLLRTELAQVLIETNDPAQNKRALQQLTEANRIEEQNAGIFRLMAIAYGRDENFGMAALSMSEQAMLEGDYKMAREQAIRAAQALPPGTPARTRAEDLKEAAKRAAENDKRPSRERDRLTGSASPAPPSSTPFPAPGRAPWKDPR
jgi:predicted Zn-dependent protease